MVVSRKIPLEHPAVVIEQLEFDLINVREKNNMPFQPVSGFPDEMINCHRNRSFLCVSFGGKNATQF